MGTQSTWGVIGDTSYFAYQFSQSSMHYSVLLMFLVSASATPLGYYYPLNHFYQYALGTQPVVISLPVEGEVLFDCKEAGSFPNRENACKSYFVCIDQGDTGLFSVTERQCSPTLAFDVNLGVCNWEESVTDC